MLDPTVGSGAFLFAALNVLYPLYEDCLDRMEEYLAEKIALKKDLKGDLREFGRLITTSGESSIRNYECGAPPLIELYKLLVDTRGVYGARFSGAGFRGCCLALVEPDKADGAAALVRDAYARRYPDLANSAGMMRCQLGDGARRVTE